MRHVVIAGCGNSSIGKELIRHFIRQGCFVTATCRERGPDPTERLNIITNLDLTDEAQAITLSHLPNVDVLVTLPASVSDNLLQRMSATQWTEVLHNTLTSVFHAIKFTSSSMYKGGNIVVLGSIVGSRGAYGCANYTAAKAGLIGLVRTTANEFIKKEIVVNLLELGYVNTGMTTSLSSQVTEKVISSIPLGRFCRVDEVCDAVQFLSNVRYMTGDILPFAGGLH